MPSRLLIEQGIIQEKKMSFGWSKTRKDSRRQGETSSIEENLISFLTCLGSKRVGEWGGGGGTAKLLKIVPFKKSVYSCTN